MAAGDDAHRPEAVARAATVPAQRDTNDPGAAAFFDLDNTMLRGASAFYLARGLYRRRFFRLRDIVSLTWHQTRFLAVGESLEQVAQMRERALVFVRGHRVTELCGIAEEVYDEGIADRIWPGALALAQAHLDAHQRVWLASATPVEMADVIARRLGLSGALGTVAEHVDGVYTGRLVGTTLHGADKAAAVEALARREGLDLSRCAAYSDSANDIPLLELVGDPCAVNPDARLRAHAMARGWRVRDYRRAHKVARVGLPTLSGVLSGAAGALIVTAVHRRRR